MPARSRITDPATSREAAGSFNVPRLELFVLCELRKFGDGAGATTHELAVHLRMKRDSISPRIKPLVEKGLVMDSGMRRPGDTGRKLIVWLPLWA